MHFFGSAYDWFMFPNPNHCPPKVAQHPVYTLVAGPITVNFRSPEAAMCFWDRPVSPAAVPKAAIDLNCDAIARERDVNLEPRAWNGSIVLPESKAVPV